MSGHNPNKNYQADEHQDVAALLRGLPQVAAPTNFDMMLKARIAQTKLEQKADVSALLQELPRVAAPSDFDFKLRARIAQAKSKEEKASPLGWFSEVFGRTFSWAQAGAAMAAVALFVGAMTFQMMKPVSNPTGMQQAVVAEVSITPSVVSTPNNSTGLEKIDAPVGQVSTLVALTKNHAPKVSPIQVKLPSPNPKTQEPKPKTNNFTVIEKNLPVPPEIHDQVIAANTVLIKHSSGETRMVRVAEVSFGLQSANLRAASPREAQNVEIASAQVIY